MIRVNGEDSGKDGEALLRHGEDAAEVIRIGEEGVEGFVGGRGEAPRIPAADEIDENDAERPNVALPCRVDGIVGKPIT